MLLALRHRAFLVRGAGLAAFLWALLALYPLPASPQKRLPSPAKPVPKSSDKPPSPVVPSLPNPRRDGTAAGIISVPATPRTMLMAGASAATWPNQIHTDLDWNRSTGSMPRIWLGVFAEEPFPVLWEPIGAKLKTASANWLRLDLFRTGFISRGADGSWNMNRAGIDRLVQTLSAANIHLILQNSPVSGMPSQVQNTFVRELAERYGAGADIAIYRFEYTGQADGTLSEYATFTEVLRSVAPDRPVGFASMGPDPVRDAEAISRLCSQKGCPLNSFAWSVRGAPAIAAQTATRIRQVLSRYPALKGTLLLPWLDPKAASGARIASLVEGLLDSCPLDQPHGLLGVLTPLQESMKNDGALVGAGETLALINQLSGSRLQVKSDHAGAHCLAAKGGTGVRLLVWRDGEEGTIPWILRLHGLPAGISIRMNLFTAGLGAAMQAGARRPDPNTASAARLIADLPTANGNAEAMLRLEPGVVHLITLTTQIARPLSLILSSPREKWFNGEVLDLDCEVRNTTGAPQNADVELLGGANAPAEALSAKLGFIAAGASRRLRFRTHLTSGRQGVTFLNVRATGDCHAALGVRVESPVAAWLAAPRFDSEVAGSPARVRVLLSNRSAQRLVIRLRAPGDTEANAPGVTLPAGGKRVEAAVKVDAPAKEAGCYPVDVKIEGDGVRLATLHPLIGVPLNCRYAILKPTIDGDLSEWTGSEAMGMGRAEQVHEKAWHGPTDLSAYAYVKWDEQFLYLACAVTDDVFFAPFPAAELLQGDSVQFAIASRRKTDASAPAVAVEHRFGMALLDGSHPVLYRFSGPAGFAPGLMKRGAVAIRRTGSRTFYEAAIAWSDLVPVQPKEGAAWNFSILVNDNDGQGRGYIAWGEGLAGGNHPELFPPIRLAR